MVVPSPGADAMQKVPPTISTRSLMPSRPRRLPPLACNCRSTLKDLPSSFIFMPTGSACFRSESAADHFDALPHAEQAEAFAALGVQLPFHAEGFAVVFYFHADAIREFLDAHLHRAGLRMTGHVRSEERR